MKITKSILLITLMLLLIVSFVPAALADQEQQLPAGEKELYQAKLNLITNEYGTVTNTNSWLTLMVSQSNGKFTLHTADGKKLLYGSGPSTSFTSLKVDGQVTKFGSSDGTFTMAPTVVDANTVKAVYSFGGVEFTQLLTFVQGQTAGNYDTLQITYECRNTTNTAKSIGLRIMLDTMIGNNDYAPLCPYGSSSYAAYETDFPGSSVPVMWEAFDDFANPTLKALGTLRNAGIETPDRFVIANWGHIYGTTYDFTYDASISVGDSAVGMWWERTLSPSGTLTFGTFYGLSGASTYTGQSFALTLNSVSSLQVVGSDYYPNPFVIQANVYNSSPATIYNGTVNLNLPAGLTLEQGAENTLSRSFESLPAGQSLTYAWTVRAQSSSSERTLTYGVTASAPNATSATIDKSITIPALVSGSPVTSVSLTANKTSPQPAGTPVTFTATASGSSNPVYQFWYQDPAGNWSSSGEYSANNTFVLNNPVAGSYTVIAYARDASIAQDAVASNVIQFVFGGAPGGTGIIVNLNIRGAGGPAYASINSPGYEPWQQIPNGGAYTYNNMTPGTYNLAIFADKYPARVIPVTVTAGQMTTVNANLVPGDTDANGLIDINDLRTIINFWDSSSQSAALRLLQQLR